MHKLALIAASIYPYVWPVAFIAVGVISLAEGHLHFELFGASISGHTLMWFMMGLAHADIFWRAWRTRQQQKLVTDSDTKLEDS